MGKGVARNSEHSGTLHPRLLSGKPELGTGLQFLQAIKFAAEFNGYPKYVELTLSSDFWCSQARSLPLGLRGGKNAI